MMIDLQSCGLFGALLCFIPAVLALENGGDYTCSISNGGKLTVRFRINRNKYPSLCVNLFDGQPFFLSSPDGVTHTNKCKMTTDITAAGNCTDSPGTLGCHCTGEDVNGYYVIEYNVDSGYETYWQANVNCADNSFSPVLEFTGINCQPATPETTTPPPTESTEPTTDDNETSDLTEEEKAGIGVGVCCAVGIAVAVVLSICLHKKKKLCFRTSGGSGEIKPTVHGNNVGNARGNEPANNGNRDGTKKSNQPSATEPDLSQKDISLLPRHSPETEGSSVSKPRELPHPRTTEETIAGQEATSYVVNETHTAAESASSAEGSRKLPQPNTGQVSTTPRLAPLNTQAANSLTSVEMNSYAESTKPCLPPIPSK